MKLQKAIEFAIDAHKEQKRLDANQTDYIVHPMQVMEILRDQVGIVDEDILAAAVLHDVIEDTKYSYDDLISVFGKTIADYVDEVTDDKNLPKQKRKDIQIETMSAKSDGAKMIKIADKISNLISIFFTPPVEWNRERKLKYFDWAKEVVDAGRGVNEKLEKMFDDVYKLKDEL